LSGRVIRCEARRAWTFTRWSASVTLMESLEARGYAYLAAGVLGLGAPAVLEIGRMVLAPTNAFVFPVGNLGMPAVSYLATTKEFDRVRRVVRQAVFIVAIGVGTYAVATWWVAEPFLSLFYGGLYDDAVPVVRALAAAHVVVCLSGIVGLCLEATGQPRPVFFAQMCGGIVGLGMAWLLLSTIGVIGVAGGMAAGASVALLMKTGAWRRQLRTDDAPSSRDATTLKA
jgi:O-antigen/teichoic acid export membrane protein